MVVIILIGQLILIDIICKIVITIENSFNNYFTNHINCLKGNIEIKCDIEINGRKESLKSKSKSKCLFPRGRDRQHITSMENGAIIWVIKMYYLKKY